MVRQGLAELLKGAYGSLASVLKVGFIRGSTAHIA
jgi:hypothetical protein